MEKELRLETTKKGLPAIWEKGGGATNTGYAQIVAGPNGEKLSPIYLRRAGSLSNSDHALFLCQEGMMVIETSHHRGDFEIRIWRVTRIEDAPCSHRGHIRSVSYYPTCPECGVSTTPQGDDGDGKPFSAIHPEEGMSGKLAILELVNDQSRGEWNEEVAAPLQVAIDAAIDKATCYHCREPHFVIA